MKIKITEKTMVKIIVYYYVASVIANVYVNI